MGARMMQSVNVFAAVFLASVAFGYGVGVGRYGWPPYDTLRMAAQKIRGPAPATAPARAPGYEARAALFRRLPGTAEIIMLGDSLTELGNWHELIPEFRVINRGIGGDMSSGVLDRLQEVIERRPKVVFVMIGTNDIDLQVPPDVLMSNLREIVTRLRDASIIPVAQSILFHGGGRQAGNTTIAAVNAEWGAFCAAQGVRFLDLNAVIAPDGHLREAMTYDGLHLTAAAYWIWRDTVVQAAAEILS